MIKLGFLLSNTGETQLSYHVIKNANDYIEHNTDLDVIGFFENTAKPWLIPAFGLMNISEAYSFDGVAVATNLETAARLSRFPSPSLRYFYMWDLEWLRTDLSYETMRDIYRDPRLLPIARTPEYASLFQRCWNRKVHATVDRADINELLTIIRGDMP
jgi:hypothetical protein